MAFRTITIVVRIRRIIMFKSCQSILALAMVASLTACSGNSSSTISNVRADKVRGYLGAANIAAAKVQAVAVSNQGQPETTVNNNNELVLAGAKTVSAPTGFYQVNLDNDRIGYPTVVIVTSPEEQARMRCEVTLLDGTSGCGDVAYLGDIKLGSDFEYRALVTDAAADMAINVNWLTHVANAFAYTIYIDDSDDGVNNPDKPQPGVYSRYRIDLANKTLSAIFKVPDILSVQPIAPSQIAQQTSIKLALQEQGIYLGAVLASIQLLKPDDLSYTAFLNQLISDFNLHQGAWLQNDNDANSVSLFDIYQAAEKILRGNIAHLRNQGVVVPSIATVVADQLQAQQTALAGKEGQYTVAPDISLSASAQREFDKIEDAKTFIADLNTRFLNFTGSDANSCTGADDDPQDCVPSFVDPKYLSDVKTYVQDGRVALKATAPDLMLAFSTLRDGLESYLAVLNGDTAPLPAGMTMETLKLPDNDGLEDETGESEKLVISSGANGEYKLYLSLLGDENTPRKPGVVTDEGPDKGKQKYYLFRFFIEGELETGAGAEKTVFHFDVGSNSAGVKSKAYVEVEYEDDALVPPLLATAEPLTYQLSWPQIRSEKMGGSTQQDFTQLFEADLAGISDPLLPDSEYRYNLKAVRYRLLAEGPLLETPEDDDDEGKRDRMEGVITLNSSAWSLYYPQHKWPDMTDFLTFRPGFDVNASQDDVFRYFVATEVIDGDNVQYLDLQLLDDQQGVQQGWRYRFFPDADETQYFAMQRCELDNSVADTPVVVAASCGDKVKRKAPEALADLEHLAEKLLLEIYPDTVTANRGPFRPMFPVSASKAAADLTSGAWTLLQGRVVRRTDGLFEYRVGEETIKTDGVDELVTYLEVDVRDRDGEPAIIQRYRLFPLSGETEKFNLQRCSVGFDAENKREAKSCDAKTEIAGEPKVETLLAGLNGLSFLVPGHGSYQMQLPTEVIIDEDGNEVTRPVFASDLGVGDSDVVAGVLVAPLSLAYDLITLRIGGELYDRNPADDADGPVGIGPLIIDAKLKVLAKDVFDISLMVGYDYRYLVDVVPTGENAQSFYLAYQAGFGNLSAPEEIGSFLVFRGGVSIAGGDPESIGIFATSVAEYELTEAQTGTSACGVVNRDYDVVGSCSNLAYLGYKGSLLAVVREERDGVYIARFVNGDFVPLGR